VLAYRGRHLNQPFGRQRRGRHLERLHHGV